MQAMSALSGLLANAVSSNLEQMNKMTSVAVASAVSNGDDAQRAQIMQMLGLGGNVDSLA